LSPSLRPLTEFARLPGREKVLLIRAWLLLNALWPLLGLFSLERLWRRCRRRMRRHAGAPIPDSREIDRIAWLVEVAGRYCRPRATCLTHSLAMAWMLAGRGVTTRLQIGVQMQGRALHAHAWLEHEGRALTPVPDLADYRTLEPAEGGPDAHGTSGSSLGGS
jgi:hypothetical protein